MKETIPWYAHARLMLSDTSLPVHVKSEPFMEPTNTVPFVDTVPVLGACAGLDGSTSRLGPHCVIWNDDENVLPQLDAPVVQVPDTSVQCTVT